MFIKYNLTFCISYHYKLSLISPAFAAFFYVNQRANTGLIYIYSFLYTRHTGIHDLERTLLQKLKVHSVRSLKNHKICGKEKELIIRYGKISGILFVGDNLEAQSCCPACHLQRISLDTELLTDKK